jgi:hypothetical protein
MNTLRRLGLVAVGCLALATPALAAEGELDQAADDPVRVLVVLVLLALGVVGFGCALAVLRVILPHVASATDRSVQAMGTGRLLAMGVLPLVGAALLGAGVGQVGAPVLGWVYLLVVAVPLVLLVLAGAAAGVPHVGGALLLRGEERSPLARSVVGALVTALAMATWVWPPLGVLVTVLIVGWFLGAGLGAVWGR